MVILLRQWMGASNKTYTCIRNLNSSSRVRTTASAYWTRFALTRARRTRSKTAYVALGPLSRRRRAHLSSELGFRATEQKAVVLWPKCSSSLFGKNEKWKIRGAPTRGGGKFPKEPYGKVGYPCQEHRPLVNGILHTGGPWRDLPERYSPWQTVFSRFNL